MAVTCSYLMQKDIVYKINLHTGIVLSIDLVKGNVTGRLRTEAGHEAP